jgi:hypothetical protein
MRLVHMNVTVNDLKALLHCTIPPARGIDALGRFLLLVLLNDNSRQ